MRFPPPILICVICVICGFRNSSHGADSPTLTIGEEKFIEAIGRDCPVVKLWPSGQVPDEPKPFQEETFSTEDPIRKREGILRISWVFDPSFIVVSPPKEKNTGAALVLCPGGGYGALGAHTVRDVAKWMNQRGITVVLLKYRVPKRHQGFDMNHQPLQDAQRAIGILRARANEWDIDPTKIGIGGFSAGGHLAASLSVNHAERTYEPIDDFDQTSCRPDFSILLYPAYLTEPVVSRTRDPELNYDLITAEATPPTLIAITRPDKFTIGSVEYYLALSGSQVPSEIHVYHEGGHGGGLTDYPFNEWIDECHRFMHDQAILAAPTPPAAHTYRAASLPDIAATDDLTLGDQRLRQLIGDHAITLPVWPNGLGPDEIFEPGPETVSSKSRGGTALNITQVTRPSLTVSLPPKSKEPTKAVLVCPGGAYRGLAAEHEGTRICQWLNENGIAGILLRYRVPRREGDFPKHHHAHQDAQRAMRLVRANAERWNLNPDEIGVLGFSAGGHLATTLCTNFETPAYEPIDAIDNESARPDFAFLIYPAYLTYPAITNDIDPIVKNLRRNVTPPMFTTVARDDKFSIGLLNYFLELQKAKLPAELHVYAEGGHGGGLDPAAYPASQWPTPALRWLKDIQPELDRRK